MNVTLRVPQLCPLDKIKNMKPKSDNLFHFTKSLNVLKLILQHGFQPRYCLEDIQWLDAPWSHLAYPMSCFCDIPLSRISEHTAFYGNYGIGLTKDWGMRNGLEPVLYIRPRGKIVQSIAHFIYKSDHADPAEKEKHNNQVMNFMRFSKPLTGQMIMAGGVVEKDFFQENEWRFAPVSNIILNRSEYEAKKDKANSDAASLAITFTPQDIRYIFLNEDSEIPELVDFIYANLGKFPHNDLKTLQSRIISLKTIESDL